MESRPSCFGGADRVDMHGFRSRMDVIGWAHPPGRVSGLHRCKVRLKRNTDGRVFDLALSSLSQKDQEWVQKHVADKDAPSASENDELVLTEPYENYLQDDWVTSEKGSLPFAIYGSKDLDLSKRYPLLLALHGKSDNNENGKQVRGWMKVFAKEENYQKHPCIILAPLCYQPHGGTGAGWSAKPGEEAIDLVEDLLENLPIDPNRVYIFGNSMGGFGATHLVGRKPRLFAAAIAVAGCTASAAGRFKRKPLKLYHAVDDDIVDVSVSQRMAKALKRSKVFEYVEFEEGGHGIAGKVFNDPKVHEWLFSQSNS